MRRITVKLKTKPKRSQNIAWLMFKSNRLALMGLVIVVLFALLAIIASAVAPYDPEQMDLRAVLKSPTPSHWFGTDALGRDILSRVLYGSRISLVVGFEAIVIAYLIGIPLGVVSGYFSGRTDYILQRFVDILMAFPGILIALMVVAILGVGLQNVMIAVGFSLIPSASRLVRGIALQVREMPYIEACRALGIGHIKIMLMHVLPNCMGPVIVQATIYMGVAILYAAGLGFLGLGAQPPTPEWGAMLSEARENIVRAPHEATFPGLMILILVLGFNFVGDGLRDALDPRLRR